MSKRHIHIGTENAERGFQRFREAWREAESGQRAGAEVHLNFEDLDMLLAVLTPRRLELLRLLRQHGPLSVRAASKHLGRNYKNVYADARRLENAGLAERTDDGRLAAPWDVIDAHVQLVA